MKLTTRTERGGWRWIGELALSLALLAALATMAMPSAASTGVEMKGFITEGIGDVLLFSPCQGKTQSKRVFRLMDKTGNEVLGAGFQEVRQMMLDRSQPVYAELRGEAEGVVVNARRLHRVIGYIDSCASSPSDIRAGTQLLASGEEPFWRFVLSGQDAQLVFEGQKKPVRFPAAAFKSWVDGEKVRTYDAWSERDGGTVRLEIQEQMCSDGRSETATGAKVTVRFGSKSFEGCAARF